MTTYIDEHRRSFGVEPICRTLQVAPSSYHAARSGRRRRAARVTSNSASTSRASTAPIFWSMARARPGALCAARGSTSAVIAWPG